MPASPGHGLDPGLGVCPVALSTKSDPRNCVWAGRARPSMGPWVGCAKRAGNMLCLCRPFVGRRFCGFLVCLVIGLSVANYAGHAVLMWSHLSFVWGGPLCFVICLCSVLLVCGGNCVLPFVVGFGVAGGGWGFGVFCGRLVFSFSLACGRHT